MSERIFTYHYGNEGEQYAFYRIPKALITDPYFKHLSTDAKLLYGLMLDRLSLSMKNNWIDERNRVYIYFTLEDICELLNCKTDKAVKLLAELDTNKGIGLIERIKQGQGKPTKIYVRKFIQENYIAESKNRNYGDNPDFGKPEVKTSEKTKSRISKNRCLDYGKTECNNTEYSKTEINKEIDRIDEPKRQAKEQIEYDILAEQFPQEELEEIVDLITEVYQTADGLIKIGERKIAVPFVQERFRQLNSMHIEYVFECLRARPGNIRNIKAYLMEVLFNASATMYNYYRAKVKHDLAFV